MPDSDGLMTQEEVNAYRLAQYMRSPEYQAAVAKQQQGSGGGGAAGTVGGVGGMVAGQYGARKISDYFHGTGSGNVSTTTPANSAGAPLPVTAGTGGYSAPAGGGLTSDQMTSITGDNGLSTPVGAQNATPVGAGPNGEILLNDHSAISPATGATIGRWAQGVGGAIQIYQGIQDFKNDKVGGSLNVASGAANVGAAAGSTTAGSVAAPLAIATGAYNTYQGFQHGGTGLRAGTTELGSGIGTAILPGIGTAIGAAAGNATGYAIKNENNWKGRLLEGPQLGLLRHFTGLSLGDLIHKTTKQEEISRWNKLFKDDTGKDLPKDSPLLNSLMTAFRANHSDQFTQTDANGKEVKDTSGTWQTGKYAGQKWSFDKALDLAKDDPQNFRLEEGNLKTFGPSQWLGLNDKLKDYIVKANIDANNYQSKMGDVGFVDEAKAKLLRDQILKAHPELVGKPSDPLPPPVSTTPSVMAQLPAATVSPSTTAPVSTGPTPYQITWNKSPDGRFSIPSFTPPSLPAVAATTSSSPTRHPGFDAKGKRINYARK